MLHKLTLSQAFTASIVVTFKLIFLLSTGQNAWWGARFLISFVEFQSRNILRMVAFNEIFLMPLAVFLIFAGNAGKWEAAKVLTVNSG
jgi:hypothetical protein